MKKLFITLAIIFIGLSSSAQDFSIFKLNDGQTVIIKEVRENPIVIIDTWIKTGSINETDQNTGVAHFLEHLFFKGTEKHPASEFDRILESKGAVTNAATSKDYTHYYIEIPSKDFDTAIELHADMLLNPLIPRKELEKERKVVLEEISKNNDDPSTTLYKQLNSTLYKEHPYKREVIGKKEVIETIPREKILEFYNKWYTPQNMITVIVGDVQTDKALAAVQKHFTVKNCTAKAAKVNYKMDKRPIGQIEISTPQDIQTAYMIMGFKGCQNPSCKDSYTLDLLSTILGDGKSSRLYKNLKEERQLVYSVEAGHSSLKEDSLFYVYSDYSQENTEKVKAEVFKEINKLKTQKITDNEIQKAKNIIERDTFYSRESISNIANEIGYSTLLTDNPKYYIDYVKNINKVTAQDLQNAAIKYLNPNACAISIIVPKNQKITQKEEVKEKKNYQASLISQNKTIKKYLMPNKSTLLINKNDSNDIIAVDIEIKGGNFTERTPGTATVTAESLLKGTKKYPEQLFIETLEETGIKISPQTKTEVFSIALKFTKKDIELAMDLLNEIVNNATLDSYKIEKIKTDKLNSIKKMKDSPQTIAFEEFKTAMWENTPYGNTSKILEKTIPRIERKDVLDYYNNLFSPENMVISVNGNIDEQKIINYFGEIFENKKNAGKIDIREFKPDFIRPETNKIIKTSQDTETSWIIMGWMTDGVLNQKDWATLQVMDSILGGGMSSRLFADLRDKQGLAYQIGSTYSSNINKGAFAIYIGTNPKTALFSRDELLREINRLKKEFISEKELSMAKDKLIGNFILSQETNMEKASTVGWLEISSRGYDFIDKYPEIIQSVSAQDIITVANKYFSSPYVLSVIGPQKDIQNF